MYFMFWSPKRAVTAAFPGRALRAAQRGGAADARGDGALHADALGDAAERHRVLQVRLALASALGSLPWLGS